MRYPFTTVIFIVSLDKARIAEKISSGDLRIFIISAGYGVVESFEPIYDYDAKMEGDVARVWKDTDLADCHLSNYSEGFTGTRRSVFLPENRNGAAASRHTGISIQKELKRHSRKG